MQIIRTATVMGEKITLTFNVENRQVNEYWAKRLEIETDAALIEHRARTFDEWATVAPLPSGGDAGVRGGSLEILDLHKNLIMIRVFEAVGVEKN